MFLSQFFYGVWTVSLGAMVLFANKELNSELLTIYTGLSTLTASIVSFWFGGRGAKATISSPDRNAHNDPEAPKAVPSQSNRKSGEQSKPQKESKL